jgi:hypothetical protein|nr:MAG TPA: protein of unknown function DUF859 [Caudoviricetes sp.]
MAVTSGSFQMSASGYTTTVGWNIARQDVAGNYTVINWWFDANWAGTSSVLSTQSAIWIAGTEVHRHPYNTGRYMRGGRIAGGQFTLYHNENGDCSFGIGGEIAIFTYAVNARGNGWWELPRIARYVQITDCGHINDEENPWVKFNNPANASAFGWLEFVKNGQLLQDEGGSTRIAERNPISNNYTWTLTEAERALIRKMTKNDASITLRYVVHGNNAPAGIHAIADRTLTIVNADPTFSVFSHKDVNVKAVGITGNNQKYIGDASEIEIKVAKADKAVGKKSAEIKNYIFKFLGVELTKPYSATEDVVVKGKIPNTVSGATVSVTAIDSRGKRTEVIKNIDVIPYKAPSLAISGARDNGFDKNTIIKVSGTFSQILVGGVEKNKISLTDGVQYRHKATSTTAWSQWFSRPCTISADKVNVANFTIELDSSGGHDIEVKLTDVLSTVNETIQISAGSPLFFVGIDGRVTIGDVPRKAKPSGKKGQLEVNGDAYANGNKLLEDIAKVIKPKHLDLTRTDNNGWTKIPLGDKIAMYITNNRESVMRTYGANLWGYVNQDDFPVPSGINILGGAVSAHHGDSAISVILKLTTNHIVGTWRNKYTQELNGKIYWSGIIIGEDV